MRLTIFGATGKTGGHLVRQALRDGYEVTALARNASKLAICHDRLMVIEGDAIDPAFVERAIQGTDAVICILNTSFVRIIAETKPVTRITQNILNSMKYIGVRRLIITSAGIPQPNDIPDLRFSLLLGIGKLIMPPAVEDTIRAAQIVQSSDIEWTVFRMVPTNSTPTGRVNAGYIKREIKVFVSRADAAMFILKELRENNWVRQAPVIFNT
jgi:NAD(P)-dependent dehydrogenase (short-subunit alcohol dehydrogenase family)